jgi:hypothetical protein
MQQDRWFLVFLAKIQSELKKNKKDSPVLVFCFNKIPNL